MVLRDDFLHPMPLRVGEEEILAGVAEGEFFVIEAELVEDGGMQVVPVDFVLDGHVTDVVLNPASSRR